MHRLHDIVCPCSNSRAAESVCTEPPVTICFYVECLRYVDDLEDEVLDSLTQQEYNILKYCDFECVIVDQDVNWHGNEYIQIRACVQISSQQKLLLDLLGSMTYELI